MGEIFTPAQAREIAQLVKGVATGAALAAVENQQGAQRTFAYGVYDPLAVPLVIWVYNIELQCEPRDFTITYGRDANGTTGYPPTSQASFDMMRLPRGGSVWTVITSQPTLVLAGQYFGKGARFNIKTLEVGDLVTIRINAHGSGKGIVGQFRTQRIGEHLGRER